MQQITLKDKRDGFLHELENLAQTKDETGRSILELVDLLREHFEKDQRYIRPILEKVSDAISGGHDVRRFDSKELECAAFLNNEYSTLCAEHKEIRKKIMETETKAVQENQNEVANLLELLVNHIIAEEEILYPVARLVSSVISSSQYSVAFDPCEITVERPLEPSNFMFGIPKAYGITINVEIVCTDVVESGKICRL